MKYLVMCRNGRQIHESGQEHICPAKKQKKSKWHKFPDVKPEWEDLYIVRTIDWQMNAAYYKDGYFGNYAQGTVSHWRKMPKPPKE